MQTLTWPAGLIHRLVPSTHVASRNLLGAATLVLGVLAGPLAGAATPRIGVVADPCADVPVQPTAQHKATDDWYGNWMREWLALDWGQRCRYAAENRALGPPGAARVVFIGDSITEGWKEAMPDFFAGDRLDRGISGQTTEQMLVRFRADVLDLKPAVVHIMGGTNDVAGNRGPTTAATIEGNLQSMVEQARAHGIAVVLASIPPARGFGWSPVEGAGETIRQINAWLKDYARREHVVYVDYHAVLDDGHGGMRPSYSEDGVHPGRSAYEAMRPLALAAISAAHPPAVRAPRRGPGATHPR